MLLLFSLEANLTPALSLMNVSRLCITSLCFLSLACSPQNSKKLTIATAANMQWAMQEITQSFTDKTGIPCQMVVSSSGKLTAQIREGAPFDVFVSADMKYPTALFQQGLATAEPTVYAYGQLVLWSRVEGLEPSVDLLTHDPIRHIALPNPKTAPYGLAAVEVLHYYNLYDAVEEKLVFGESVAQANQFIVSQAAEIGFTAKAVVLSPNLQGTGRWQELNPDTYSPIAQGVVVLAKQTGLLAQAQSFYDFLLSKEGQKILVKYGYAIDIPQHVPSSATTQEP